MSVDKPWDIYILWLVVIFFLNLGVLDLSIKLTCAVKLLKLTNKFTQVKQVNQVLV